MAQGIEFISIDDIKKILFNGEKLSFSDNVYKRVKESFEFLDKFSKERC